MLLLWSSAVWRNMMRLLYPGEEVKEKKKDGATISYRSNFSQVIRQCLATCGNFWPEASRFACLVWICPAPYKTDNERTGHAQKIPLDRGDAYFGDSQGVEMDIWQR
jgi:hypothetical protein